MCTRDTAKRSVINDFAFLWQRMHIIMLVCFIPNFFSIITQESFSFTQWTVLYSAVIISRWLPEFCRGKLSRVLSQFTPYVWTEFDWRPTSSLKRWLSMHFVTAMVSRYGFLPLEMCVILSFYAIERGYSTALLANAVLSSRFILRKRQDPQALIGNQLNHWHYVTVNGESGRLLPSLVQIHFMYTISRLRSS